MKNIKNILISGLCAVLALALLSGCAASNISLDGGSSAQSGSSAPGQSGTSVPSQNSEGNQSGSLPSIADSPIAGSSNTLNTAKVSSNEFNGISCVTVTSGGTYTLSGSVTSSSPNLDSISLSFTGSRLVIEPAELTITTGSAEKKYDGKPLTCPDVSVTGLVGDDTVTVKATGKQTEIGYSANTYEIDWGSTDPACYKVVENLGILSVEKPAVTPTPEPTPIPLTISSPTREKTYDGKDMILTQDDLTITGLQDGDSISVRIADGSIRDAGSITPSFTVVWGSVDSNKYTVDTQPGTLYVEKAPLKVTTPSHTMPYDGLRALPLTTDKPTLEGLVPGEFAIIRCNENQLKDVADSPKTNDYTINWDSAKMSNYQITEKVLGTLTVNPATLVIDCNYGGEVVEGEWTDRYPTVTCNGRSASSSVDDPYTFELSTGDKIKVTLTGVPTPDDEPETYIIGHSIQFLSGSSGNYDISYINDVFTILPDSDGD